MAGVGEKEKSKAMETDKDQSTTPKDTVSKPISQASGIARGMLNEELQVEFDVRMG